MIRSLLLFILRVLRTVLMQDATRSTAARQRRESTGSRQGRNDSVDTRESAATSESWSMVADADTAPARTSPGGETTTGATLDAQRKVTTSNHVTMSAETAAEGEAFARALMLVAPMQGAHPLANDAERRPTVALDARADDTEVSVCATDGFRADLDVTRLQQVPDVEEKSLRSPPEQSRLGGGISNASPLSSSPIARGARDAAHQTDASAVDVDIERNGREESDEQQAGRHVGALHEPSSAERQRMLVQDSRTTDARRDERPRTRRERITVPAAPFAGAVAPVSDRYAVWNAAIIRYCLEASASGDEIYLAITPSVLAAALNDSSSSFVSADEATAQFVDAVNEMYKVRVLPHARKLETLRRCGSDGLPECAAFLALSVLAAYRMHREEGTAAAAYYKRLDELLGCGMAAGMPTGFDGDDFQALWVFLNGWFSHAHGRRLAMPSDNTSLRRFLALPLTHVPLREVDIMRLPTFFEWAGYTAGELVAPDVLVATLLQWTRSYGGFTRAGNEALADERQSAVLAQVAHQLMSWDGSSTDAQGRRTATVEIFLHWRRRLPVLSFLPRRPAVFPAIFDDGEHVLDAGQDGWYEPTEISTNDGRALLDGFAWETSAADFRFVLRRHGSNAIALAPSEFEGPISHGALVMGAPGAVLCIDSVLPQVFPYLERITGKRCVPQPAPGIRSGWKLISDVRPIRRESPPEGLESLAIERNVAIVASGGLRVGNRRAWIIGAPPRIVVTGCESGDVIKLDDERVTIDKDGAIIDDGRLAHPGSHVVQVGHIRYRLDTVQPDIAAVLSPTSMESDPVRQYAVALPGGCWTILGAYPGDVAHAAGDRTQRSILTACAFRPVWAISVGIRGAVVRRLTTPVPLPASMRRRAFAAPMRPWADAIYAAHVRHPKFQSDGGAPEPPDSMWMIYAHAAKSIKRALKATRR